jgi:hypothetical protein
VRRPDVRWIVSTALILFATMSQPAFSQESKLGAEVRLERERLSEKCDSLTLKKVVDCGYGLVTDHPFHIALGSLAPRNGLGFGVAFVPPQSKPNDDWRINWSADAVGAISGGWRVGAYMKFVNTRVPGIGVTGPGGGTPATEAQPRPYPTLTLYAQMISLPKLSYFGLGNDTLQANRSLFAMRQSTLGARIVWPFGRTGTLNRLNPSLIGELNGRWVQITGSTKDDAPSIELLNTEETAPGLSHQPATLQLGEGLRIAPAVGRLQLIYTGVWQQYVASSNSSFRRWTVDLGHEWSLWTTTRSPSERETNTPNECATSVDRTVGEDACPGPTSVTTSRVGTVGFRALISRSAVSDGRHIPFYFQPTIGGSNINGERLLASYEDYRFRAPNLFVLQETFEHVVWGPLGAFVSGEQGRVALIHDSRPAGTLRKTFALGLTGRFGGAPLVTAWFATGGGEGHHFAVTMNASLFGGSSRPSLY